MTPEQAIDKYRLIVGGGKVTPDELRHAFNALDRPETNGLLRLCTRRIQQGRLQTHHVNKLWELFNSRTAVEKTVTLAPLHPQRTDDRAVVWIAFLAYTLLAVVWLL